MALKTSLLRFKFEDFDNLTSEPGDFVNSSEAKDCYGGVWLPTLYPGGNGTSTENSEGRVMELRRFQCGSLFLVANSAARNFGFQ